MTKSNDYRDFFSDYIKSASQIEVDIRFWKHFLTVSIDKYKSENPINRGINQSGFFMYNIPVDGRNMWLYSADLTFTIEIDDLTEHNNNFFFWVMNLSLIRMYNSLELLLFQSIQKKYFPELESPLKGKKEISKIVASIKEYLKINGHNIETKNNRHLISFLMKNSIEISSFFNNSVNHFMWQTNWKDFYELISILRNVITHHGMLVSQNVRNEINSIARDIYNHYFQQASDTKAAEILKAKDEQSFLGLINHINDFSGNITKFIAGEQDLRFLGLNPS